MSPLDTFIAFGLTFICGLFCVAAGFAGVILLWCSVGYFKQLAGL